MRSLSPAPSRYSPAIGDVSAREGGSAADRPRGRKTARTAAAAAKRMAEVVCFMAVSSVLIGGRTQTAPPVDKRPRDGLAFQGFGVDGVGRIAGGADGDAQRVLELVVLDPRDDAVDHPRRMLEVGVEQHQRERALAGVP